MSNKPVILLCWGYNRRGWIEHFEALNGDFEFVYLFYYRKEDETDVCTSNRRIYFMDYGSPQEMLADIRPLKVVFMGLDGLQSIALNIAAKKQGIKTIFMMHGAATLKMEDYSTIVYERRNLLRETVSNKLRNWLFTLKFLIKALGMKNIGALPLFVSYQYQRTKMFPAVALAKHKTPLRNPDQYIVFSRNDIPYYLEQDGSSAEDFVVLGNMEISSYVLHAKQHGLQKNGYMLYLETPLSTIEGNEFDNVSLTPQEYAELILSFNRYAQERGLRLFIKLHPYNYQTSYFPQHPNIEYFRDTEKEPLLLNSDGVIVVNSSLTIPALLFKPVVMVYVNKRDGFQDAIAAIGICPVVEAAYFAAQAGSRDFHGYAPDDAARRQFLDTYIGANEDGKALDRLRAMLAD